MRFNDELFAPNFGEKIFSLFVGEDLFCAFAAIPCKDVDCDGFWVTDFLGVEAAPLVFLGVVEGDGGSLVFIFRCW